MSKLVPSVGDAAGGVRDGDSIAVFDSPTSFAMAGAIANRMIAGTMVKGMGDAMDLVHRAARVLPIIRWTADV